MSRKEARETVFKLVYERCVCGERNEFSFGLYTEEMSEEDINYCREIYDGIDEKAVLLNSIVEKYSSAFRIERVFKVDLAILLVAAYEILFGGIPHQVAANEAVELAKKYSTEKSFKFINGVLSSVIKDKDQLIQSL